MTAASETNKEANASAGSTENEEIIELTDEIKATPQNDEEIIELIDEVVKTDSTSLVLDADTDVKQEADISDTLVMGAEAQKAIMSEKDSSTLADGEIKIGDDIDDELDLDEGEQDGFVNSLGMDLETDSAISQPPEENEPLPESAPAETASIATDAISPEQIEAVIERIIMKILPEKIDSILSAAIEKTLAGEIEKIKTLLLEDSSGDNV